MHYRSSLALLVALAACGGDDGDTQPDATAATDAGVDSSAVDAQDFTPHPTYSTSPVANLPAGTRFASGIPYGPDPQQVFDVFLPELASPTGVVIYIHGGGFTGGTRTDAYGGSATSIHYALDNDLAFVSLDYRLLLAAGTETEGVNKSLHDCEYALQFIRHYASTFNIDKTRVGLTGVSAGAGTSLWLAYHSEMADPTNADPVKHESTRPTVAGVSYTQATYDVYRWAMDVFHGEYDFVTNDLLLNQMALRSVLVQFYGLDGALVSDAAALKAKIESPEMVTYRADDDMLALMSMDDPPTYIFNDNTDTFPGSATFDLLHHPLHGKALVTAAAAANTNLTADVPAYQIDSPLDGNGAMAFVISFLGVPI